MNTIIKDIKEAISTDNKPKAYDTPATVTRVEGSTVWVHIAGGVDETPVKKTINAKEGDTVQVRISNGSAWLMGNATAPPTDDARANAAIIIASTAEEESKIAHDAAISALESAVEAKGSADSAKASAENASEYAARALGNLSTVQSVTETLTWITQHGTMELTQDVALDPTHVYFVQDAGGDYVVGGVTYAIVTEPDVDDIGTYYELTIDESLNNYVGTHLALTSEGLWLLPASTGTNKVLIATGAGSVYTTAGTYIIDSDGTTVLASFRADGATMNASNGITIAHLGYGPGTDGGGGTSDAPYYTLGYRVGTVGNYSVAEGEGSEASGYVSHAEGGICKATGTYSHAEGFNNTASGTASHAEGTLCTASNTYAHAEGAGSTASGSDSHAECTNTTASGDGSHAEGAFTIASGDYSHAQNAYTKASSDYQTALGAFNIEDNADTYAVIVGNGTSDNARSNALTVGWDGNVTLALDTTASPGTTDGDLYAAITALSWQSDVIV